MTSQNNHTTQPTSSLSDAARRIAAVLLFGLAAHDSYATHQLGTFPAYLTGALSCLAILLLTLAVGSLLRAPEGTYDD